MANFIKKYKLDGINLDWVYPAKHGGVLEDKTNFITFIRDLRKKLGSNKIISAAVTFRISYIGSSYDVQGMNQYLNFINLKTYDFHGSYDIYTGHNTPLYAGNANGNDNSLNADACVTAWINAGVSPAKILLGLSFFGINFRLRSTGSNGVGALSLGAGPAGPYSKEPGTLTYLEICMNINEGGWTTVYDNQQHSLYSFKGNHWVSYENVESVKIKAQYAINRGLGGVMIWAIDHDDFRNACGGGSMPLLNAVNSVIRI